MLPLHHTPIIFQRPCTDDWVRTNDLQNMSLLLLPTELHQYLEQSKGIEPSLFLLGREIPYHQANSAFVWVGRDSNPLTARPIRQFVFRLDLQSSAVTYPIHPFITPSRLGSRTLHLRYLKSSQGEPHIRLALCCSISWNRTKFLWTSLQRVLCLRRPSF